mgnify:CR=1 FL=1
MNSHISIKGMEAYGGSYYNSFVALYSHMAYQTELLSRLFPSSEVDNQKGYQSKIFNKYSYSFIPKLRNDIFKFLHLDPIDETRWERERTKFLKEVKGIDYKI